MASALRSLGNAVSCLCALKPRSSFGTSLFLGKSPSRARPFPYASEFLADSPVSDEDGDAWCCNAGDKPVGDDCSQQSTCSTTCSLGLPDPSDLQFLEDMLRSQQERNAENYPLHMEELPGVELNCVANMLFADDWIISHLLHAEPRVSNVAVSLPMAGPSGGQLDGAQVRRSEFVMQLPQDLPRAVTALVGMPETTRVTQVSALRVSEEEIVLVQQTTSHDVMFGDNFRIRAAFCWRPSLPASKSNVEQRMWSEVWWASPLSWTFGAITAAVDYKSKEEAAVSAAALAKMIRES